MSADITIIGLGPGPIELRTLAAQHALDNSSQIFLRTHGGVNLADLLGKPHVTDLEQYHDLHAINRWQKAAEMVIEGAKDQPVALAIPGHPRFGEGLVQQVIELADGASLSTDIVDGVSATDMLASALGIDPILNRVQLIAGRTIQNVDNESPFDGGLINVSPRLPVLITHVYNQEILAAVQSQLMRVFPPNHEVLIINAAGLPDEARTSTTIGDLSSASGGQLWALYVPPIPELEASRTPATLQHIVARLRREDGCPWDRKQTNGTLASSLVDEVYEAVDAINAGDDANLAEELGDLLLLIMMHAQIAEERGAFALEDVYHGITTKIVRRHPHVFGNDAAANADEVIGLWQEIKKQEKAEKPNRPEKAIDGQPHSMPALERSVRVLKKHPVDTEESTEESRQRALLNAVASVVAAGEDPAQVLKQALENHVTGTVSAGISGEKNASN